MNAGIDYGRGETNIDKETGIRYGVIGQNSICCEAYNDMTMRATDIGYENAVEEKKQEIRAKLEAEEVEDIEAELEERFEEFVDQGGFEFTESGPYRFQDDEYKIETTEQELFVIKSPYYTFAQFCSPCAPGAGHLECPMEDGVKTYCLGEDWFDKEYAKCPYPIYRVADDVCVFTPPVEE